MRSMGHLSSAYTKLLSAIHAVGGVACEQNPDLWYPEDIADPMLRHQASAVAKGLCHECPIKKQCFEYALRTNQRYGIWGGTSPEER